MIRYVEPTGHASITHVLFVDVSPFCLQVFLLNFAFVQAIPTPKPDTPPEATDDEASRARFPWKHLLLLALLCFVYYSVMERTTALSYVTPAFNLITMAVVIGYGLYSLRN